MLHPRLPGSLTMVPRRTTLAMLVAMVETSPVRVPARTNEMARAHWVPAGYDRTDIEILEWIASHRRGRVAVGSSLNKTLC